MTARRRIMREFTIKELSAVDRPAQKPATVAIMKREDDGQENEMDMTKIAAFDSFDEAVAAIAEREGCPQYIAMSKAAATHPDLLTKYQTEGDASIAKAADDLAKRRGRPVAVQRFEMIVDGIATRDGVARHVAMQRARRENPDAFAAFQAA